jgi:soluble lytic murein transglycosylase-like protein
MKQHVIAILTLLAASATVGLRPAQAQIASYVDPSGRRIYTNQTAAARKPAARHRSYKPSQTPPTAPPHTRPVLSAPLANARGSVIPGPSRPSTLARDREREPIGDRKVAVLSSNGGRRAHVTRSRLEQIVQDRAVEHGLDPRLVRAVVKTESAWNPAAVSSKGAEGLMQLIPATAERFNVQDVFNPVDNVEGGVRYLHELLARYDGDLAKSLAAYYAGEKRIDRAGGVPRDPATEAYVRRVTRFYLAAIAMQLPGSAPIHRFVDGEGRTIYTNE